MSGTLRKNFCSSLILANLLRTRIYRMKGDCYETSVTLLLLWGISAWGNMQFLRLGVYTDEMSLY